MKVLFACSTDNDGYPVCMGDGSMCAGDSCDQLDRPEAPSGDE
jgi:hypothetical protein